MNALLPIMLASPAYTRAVVELSPGRAPTSVRPRLAALALVLIGALCALISLASTSWYAITGSSVIHSSAQVRANSPGPLVLVDPNLGTRHSVLVWTVFAICTVTAIAACVPLTRQWSSFARISAPVLATLLLAVSVARVAVTRFALGDGSPVPADVRVEVHIGFWLALAGFASIGLGAALGPRTATSGG